MNRKSNWEEYIPYTLTLIVTVTVLIIIHAPCTLSEAGEPDPITESVLYETWETVPEETDPVIETETESEAETETETATDEEDFYDSLELLAYCTMAEAGNQPEEGKRLVIDTVLNRVDSKYFPDTVEGVIFDPGQFEVVSRGTLYLHCPTDDIYDLIREEIAERTNDKVIYFTAGGYNPSGEPWQKVGDHYFSYIRKSLQEERVDGRTNCKAD